jgi:hypothetical protein
MAAVQMDPARGVDEVAAIKLRRYLHATYAVLGLLAGLGVGPHEAVTLTMCDIDYVAATVSVGGRTLEIPAFASGVLRAHVVMRLLEGADDGDALFVMPARKEFNLHGSYSTVPLSRRGAKLRLRMVTAETGLALTSYWGDQVRRDDRRWGCRRGVLVQAL